MINAINQQQRKRNHFFQSVLFLNCLLRISLVENVEVNKSVFSAVTTTLRERIENPREEFKAGNKSLHQLRSDVCVDAMEAYKI